MTEHSLYILVKSISSFFAWIHSDPRYPGDSPVQPGHPKSRETRKLVTWVLRKTSGNMLCQVLSRGHLRCSRSIKFQCHTSCALHRSSSLHSSLITLFFRISYYLFMPRCRRWVLRCWSKMWQYFQPSEYEWRTAVQGVLSSEGTSSNLQNSQFLVGILPMYQLSV